MLLVTRSTFLVTSWCFCYCISSFRCLSGRGTSLCLVFLCVLQKGCGYHLDLLVVAIMLGICSVMGLPWFVAATVLSISHVNSLKLESGSSAPGAQPRFLGIREQRVTGLMIFVLMGCSVFMTSALKVKVVKPTGIVFNSNCNVDVLLRGCLFIVYPYASSVWSLSLHGCLLVKRYSGESPLLWGIFYFNQP